jgi:predicted small secreted protein
MRKAAFFALALTGALVCACNTVEGIGKDVQAAGRGLESASNDARSDNQPSREAQAEQRGSRRP